MIHLHVHTPYSLLDGYGRSKEYVERAIELNQPAVAISDHGVLYGAYEHYKACNSRGVKPIIGCEVYITPDHTIKDKKVLSELPFDNSHLVLLAKNNIGLKNLFELATKAMLDGFYSKPRLDDGLLRQHSEGLIALSGCLGGQIPRLILRGEIETAKAVISSYQGIFGDFYLEMQANTLPQQAFVNNVLQQLSVEMNVPLVVSCDCHYVNQEDGIIHKQFTRLGKNMDTAEDGTTDDAWDSFYKDTWMMSDDQILALGIPQVAIDNTHIVADMCNVAISTTDFHMPNFDIPPDHTLDSYLIHLAWNGLFTKYLEEDFDLAVYSERLLYELDVITSKGYAGYFLIVHDLIQEAARISLTGPGRGSAAGCLVSYVIGITKVDPIKHGLLFERFLNPERPSMPDIDLDVDSEVRQELIEYLCNKYGHDNVCQIATVTTLQSKFALKDAARVSGIDFSLINSITRTMPDAYNIAEAIELDNDFAAHAEEHKDMFKLAQRFEGTPRQIGVHAAGVVVAPDKLTNFIPLARGKNSEIISQFDKDTMEELGLLKIDLLGLKTLGVINKSLRFIRQNHGIDLDINKVPLDDTRTLRLISSGRTVGVFQLESPGMQNVFIKINNIDFNTLIAGIALYRPGPMALIGRYTNAVNGYSVVEYSVPELEPILKDTYGVIIYQEQTMRIATDLAGFTPGQADLLRKAIGKKKIEVMEESLGKLVNGNPAENIPGMIAMGIPQEQAEQLADDIRSFASYGFNKSHACSYAMLAFQTAYLKAHYPTEFMCANLCVYYDDQNKFPKYLEETKRMGIPIMSPDVNYSEENFSIKSGAIIYGLAPIKGMSIDSARVLIENRPINDIQELSDLPKRYTNKKVLSALAFSGALDNITDGNRIRAFTELLTLRKDKADPPLFNERIKYELEYDTLKVLISGHPLADIAKVTDWQLLETGQTVDLYCLIKSIKEHRVKSTGRPMAFLLVETLEGPREVVIFSSVYETLPKLENDMVVKVALRKSKDTIVVNKLTVSKKYNKKKDD